jgi:lysyl-tRNA synthetase class 1
MTNNIKDYTLLKSWPFLEARRILEHISNKTPKKGYVLFETGYGPSGLPHIGTFGEVFRTTRVINAFKEISDIPTKLICFSDDMDGLRKVPTNIPNQEMVAKHMNLPLTSIPDPFEEKGSFGEYMNSKMMSFLDQFNFEYEFYSATKHYKAGMFNEMLINALDKYDEIMSIMLPSLGEERQSTYSPFMPVCPETGKVLQVPIKSIDKKNSTVTYIDSNNKEVTVSILDGSCKLQWKPDFAMRWAALDVDYEMYGKDHRPNADIYSNICKVLGVKPPVQYFYEMFLGEDGAKISKSKGNGISIDDWLKYAPLESLALFMFQSPNKAKRLFFDVIPKTVDEYITFVSKYHNEPDIYQKFDNPVHHIHNGNVPTLKLYNLSFNLLLNLASVCNPDDTSILWGFISKYSKDADRNKDKFLDQLANFAVIYYNDFIKPYKTYLKPDEKQKSVLAEIFKMLETLDPDIEPSMIQNNIYDIGMKSGYENLRDYFKDLYQILLGQTEGPRLGSFIKLYGVSQTIELIKSKLI